MNRHQFEQAAKGFRAGRITLEDFSDQVFSVGDSETKANGKSISPKLSDVTNSTNSDDLSIKLPARNKDAHKGDFGRVLFVGGSDGMGGAIGMSGLSALRAGSGLVVVAAPVTEQDNVARLSPCLMTLGLHESKGRIGKDGIDLIVDKCEWADVVAVGPGMGRSKSLQKIVSLLYDQLPQPMIIDADGLNNLAASGCDLGKHEGMRILTPHPGEFQRLDGLEKTTDRKTLESRAKSIADKHDLTIVLKGNQTLVTDGKRDFVNQTGNPGMATAGSGDVLTGIVASFVGQGLAPFEAACYAVRIHGLAGDLAAYQLGQISLIATDLIEYLPAAFAEQ